MACSLRIRSLKRSSFIVLRSDSMRNKGCCHFSSFLLFERVDACLAVLKPGQTRGCNGVGQAIRRSYHLPVPFSNMLDRYEIEMWGFVNEALGY